MVFVSASLAGCFTDHRELPLATYLGNSCQWQLQFSVGKRELLHDGIRKRFTRGLSY